MNKRDYKITGEDGYFHIFNRGNGLQDIFLDDDDYNFFLLKLKQNMYPDASLKRMHPLPEGSYSLLSFCLMPNHFHLLIEQIDNISISKLISKLCTSYAKYINKKYKRLVSSNYFPVSTLFSVYSYKPVAYYCSSFIRVVCKYISLF